MADHPPGWHATNHLAAAVAYQIEERTGWSVDQGEPKYQQFSNGGFTVEFHIHMPETDFKYMIFHYPGPPGGSERKRNQQKAIVDMIVEAGEEHAQAKRL